VIEKSDVNEGIAETADKEPSSFWYFNNGVTAICDSFAKKPFGGNQTDSGVFDIQKISVINGAQTIGSLAKAKSSGVNIEDVFVHVRIISLQGTPEGFASSVTRSNNTQNDLNASDFVAFDLNQERLRREAVQLGITYAFRRGEPDRKATPRTIQEGNWCAVHVYLYKNGPSPATAAAWRPATCAVADMPSRTAALPPNPLCCPTGKSRINLVHTRQRKYSPSRFPQITPKTPPSRPTRGAYPDRQKRGAGCGGRGSVGVNGDGRAGFARERSPS
jgi:hypothetical protein